MTKAVQDLMVEVARIRDAFHAAIYSSADLEAAMALTTTGCTLTNIPSGTGGTGEGLRPYLAEGVLPHLPADLSFRRVSRTGDRWRVAQEDMVGFTHDRELLWLLPSVAPTGRHVEVLAVSVVTIERSRIASHRTLWDQTALLAQLGLNSPGSPLSAGQGRLDPPAAVRGRPGQQLTAQLLDAFAQTGQPAAGTGQVQPLLHRTVVLHPDGQARSGAVDQHPDGRAGGVAQRVGQALLDHPEGDVGRPGGYGVVASLEPARDVQPAAGGSGHDLVDQGQIGSAGLRPAEQLHQAVQVLAALPG